MNFLNGVGQAGRPELRNYHRSLKPAPLRYSAKNAAVLGAVTVGGRFQGDPLQFSDFTRVHYGCSTFE